MGKIKLEYETMYDKGDVVIFNKNNFLEVGIITAYYQEDNCIWYNIAINKDVVYTYTNGGDIGEFDIIAKIEDKYIKEKVIEYVKGIEL